MSMGKMIAVAIGITAAGIVGILLFTELWYRIGLGAAIAVLVGIVLYIGWRSDQKAERMAREELEGI